MRMARPDRPVCLYEVAEAASGAFESGGDAAIGAQAATASGAFDGGGDAVNGALTETASGAFESDETAATATGAFDAAAGIDIGAHAAL